MGVETVLALFEEVSCHKPEDVTKLVKKLEQQWRILKSHDLISLTQRDLNTISRQGSNAYFKAVTSAKLARATYKVIKCFPKVCEEALQKDLIIRIEKLFVSTDLSDLKTLSLLLDQNQDAKSLAKSSFGKLSKLLSATLNKNLTTLSQQDAKEHLHCGAKLCIQALQLCKINMQQLLKATQEHSSRSTCSHVENHGYWKKIVLILISHLMQISNRDYLLLVGTALAMLFNCAPSLQIIESSYLDIISLVSQERNTFEFCSIHFCQDSSTEKDTFLPVIAMIKGLLVSCDKNTLKSGKHPLIFQVFAQIHNYCKGPTSQHYLSFQILALWCQKLEELDALRPSVICLHFIAPFLNCDGSKKNRLSSERFEQGITTKHNLGTNLEIKEDIANEGEKESSNDPAGPYYMSAECPVLSSILDCIWLNWDNPVDGVSEYVLEIFRRLLNIWFNCVQDGTSNYSNLCEELFERVISMAWYSKTRYKPLSLLLPHINHEKAVALNSRLRSELLMCMKTNHLASVASDTYKACLHQLLSKKEEFPAKNWEITWMPVLISGLQSEHMLQRLKVSTYWLEPTITLVASSEELLLSHLQKQLLVLVEETRSANYERVLYAWTVISRVARENLHSCIQLHCEDLVHAALSSYDDLVRAEAFHLLASTVKKSEPVSELEIKLFMEFIPFNLKTDSASFRHNLSSSICKALVRVRDSCLSSVRAQTFDSSILKQGLVFVNWLYELLMLSLAPGSSYQRRQTTFDLLFVLLETLMYQEDCVSKKGKAHEKADILVKYAQKEGLWNFFSSAHFLTLLHCLEDGAEEIQKESFKLLNIYFKWPNMIDHDTSLRQTDLSSEDSPQLVSKLSFARQLMDRAFYLITRPRAYENHSGLLLFSLVLDKYIIDQNMAVLLAQDQTFSLNAPQTTPKDRMESDNISCDSAFNLLNLLVSQVENSLEALAKNVAANVKMHPVHGILQCINRCLTCISHHIRKRQLILEDWHSKLKHVIKLNYRVIDFILDILAGGKSITDCPSFADIGSALENLVSLDEEQDGETTTLSPEFQLLLSWCWINLKESCSCLAGVTASSLLMDRKSCLDETVLQSVGGKFIKVLTTCRHRGAIEGCRSGLYQFSLSLMSSNAGELVHIPRVILQEVLESLSGNCLTSSVTRRSAGLPVIVQTILQAACRCEDLILLQCTVKELYSFAIEPLPQEHSQQHDLRQSHALNILKAIFCDASLAPRLMSLSKVVILVIEGFDSSSWAIRNAATQLISTLVTRIFGQKSKIGSTGSMSLEEFSTLYPDLLSHICSKLNVYMESGETLVRPSLYVMLTILANLGPMPRHQDSASCRSCLQRAAEFFLGSPVYSLRKLAAQVWVSLSPLDQADSTLQEILQQLLGNRTSLNSLHGWLLCAYNIFSSGHKSFKTSHMLINFCVANQWLTSGGSSCLLIASLVMQTIQLALGHIEVMNKQLLSGVWSLSESFLTSVNTNAHALQVAKKQCLSDCINTLHMLCQKSTDSDLEIRFQKVLEKHLKLNDPELQAEVLECLYEGLRGDTLTLGNSLQSLLWKKMLFSSHSLNFIKTVEILLILKLKKYLIEEDIDTHIGLSEAIASESKNNSTLCLRKAYFDLEGIIIGISSDERLLKRMRAVAAWCDLQVQFSCPTANESIRLSAASSLRTCGVRIIDFCSNHKDLENVDVCLVNIAKSTLTLLEDTEDDVRQEVSLFINQLCNQAKIHYSIAYSAFSEFISEKLFWCSGLCSLLLEFLYRKDSIRNTVTRAFSSESGILFEAETCSAMSEEHISRIWAFFTLKNMLKHPGVCSKKLREITSAASKDLRSMMPLIYENFKGRPIFNISVEESVLSVFLGVFLLVALCKTMSNNAVETEFMTAVSDLHKVQGLHPFLWRRYYDSDQLIICNLLDTRDFLKGLG